MRILVCDGDVVEEKNLIRQNFVEQDVGRNKAQVLAERYSAAFGIECEYIPRFVENDDELFQLTVPDFSQDRWRGIPETNPESCAMPFSPNKRTSFTSIPETESIPAR